MNAPSISVEPVGASAPAPSPRPARKWLRILLTVLFVLVALGAGGSWYWFVQLRQIRQVTPECFRSAQKDAPTLEQQIKANQLKTIVNLRGLCQAPWYDQENALCKKLGVEMLDIKIDPLRLPRPNQLNALIAALDSAPKPLLIHCRNGADRTSFAAALELILKQNVAIKDAIAREMSWSSAHIRTGNNDAGERFFELYEQSQQSKNPRQSVREWIQTDYPAIYEKLGPYGSVNGPVRTGRAAKADDDSDSDPN